MDKETVRNMQHVQLGQKKVSISIHCLLFCIILLLLYAVTVAQARNLCSTKGESFPVHSYVKTHFLGEDAELDPPVRDNKCPVYNFSRVHEKTITPQLVYALLNDGLDVIVMEGGSHRTILGTAHIDLTPLVLDVEYGRVVLPTEWYPLNYANDDTDKDGAYRTVTSEVEVSVTISQPLLSQEEFNKSNLVTLKVDGGYSLPARWTPKGIDSTTNPFKYVLHFNMPGVENRLACDGELSLPFSDTEVLDSAMPQQMPQNIFSNNTGVSRVVSTVFTGSSADGNNGTNSPLLPEGNEFATEEEHYRVSELSKPRILWDYTHKILLGATDIESWCASIKAGDSTAMSNFDLTRHLKSQYMDSKDHNEQKYRGQVIVDLKPLLSKGVRCIVGRFKVSPSDTAITEVVYNSGDAPEEMDKEDEGSRLPAESDMLAMGDEPRDPSPKYRGRGSKSPPKRERRLKKSITEPTESGQIVPDKAEGKKKRKSKVTEPLTGRGPVSRLKMRGRRRRDMEKLLQLEPSEDINPYEAAHTYLKIEIMLAKPLVVKPPTPRNVLKPSDFIPKRAPLPHFFQLKEATEEYHAQLKQIITELALEYRKLFGAQAQSLSRQEQQKKLVFELNNKGRYFVMKEKLKKSVVRVVREKFQFAQNSTGQLEQLETFLSELYVYLTDQMHSVIVDSTAAPNPSQALFNPGQSSELLCRLKEYADEAEILLKHAQAALCHQERVVHNKYNAQLWYDYGCFALRMHDDAKAEECFHEAISLDNQHVQSLASYGLLIHEKGDPTKAEVFIRSAASLMVNGAPLLGLLEFLTNEGEVKETARAQQDNGMPVYLQVVQYLLSIHFPKLAEWVLEQSSQQISQPDSTTSGRGIAKLLDPTILQCWASINIQKGDFSRAEEALEQLLVADNTNLIVWSLVGDVYYRQKQTSKAITAYKTVLGLLDTNSGEGGSYTNLKLTALLRLGELHTLAQNFDAAKTIYLEACSYSPTSAYAWLGTGVTCFKMARYDEAEDALAEANLLNHHDAETWGYLTLLCFHTSRSNEANQAFKQALKLHLSDTNLLCEIGKCYMSLQKRESYVIAEQCFRTALKNSPDSSTSQIRVLLENTLQAQHTL